MQPFFLLAIAISSGSVHIAFYWYTCIRDKQAFCKMISKNADTMLNA